MHYTSNWNISDHFVCQSFCITITISFFFDLLVSIIYPKSSKNFNLFSHSSLLVAFVLLFSPTFWCVSILICSILVGPSMAFLSRTLIAFNVVPRLAFVQLLIFQIEPLILAIVNMSLHIPSILVDLPW